MADSYKLGEAAAILGVRPETLRRWDAEGRIRVDRTAGGHRRFPVEEVARIIHERWQQSGGAGLSARNRFSGIVTRVERDTVVALVEVMAGPHRVVSILTCEAVDQLGIRPGVPATAVVKATNVMVETEQ